jgi:hypothetical protein
MTEVRSQMTDDRGQRTEDRGQKSEALECGSRNLRAWRKGHSA